MALRKCDESFPRNILVPFSSDTSDQRKSNKYLVQAV